MAGYQGISPTFFDEPEYEDSTEQIIMLYIMVNRDMAGVCQIYPPLVAKKCRTSVRKLAATLEKFEKMGKGKRASTGKAFWLQSGINHSLFKGHFTSTQMSSVIHSLTKWQASGIFGEKFALEVVQVYASKYNLRIPYVLPEDGASYKPEPYTYTQTDIQTEPTPLPPNEPEPQQIELPEPESILPDPTPANITSPKKVGSVGFDLKNQKSKKTGSGPIDSAYTNMLKAKYSQKFGQEIPDEEILRLLNGENHFQGFRTLTALGYAIGKIGGKPGKPINVIIDFAQNPGKYLKDAEYDEFKRLLRGPDTPAP